MIQKEKPVKSYPTIACCGIDCGLCPQYHSQTASQCPGCGGKGFYDHHPSCGILTCCVTNQQLETCADCTKFPCNRLEKWDTADSMVSHKNSIKNLYFIQKNSVSSFLENQKPRIKLLETLIREFNEGRSKSFFCVASTLLSIDGVGQAIQKAKYHILAENIPSSDLKAKAKIMKKELESVSIKENIDIKLRK